MTGKESFKVFLVVHQPGTELNTALVTRAGALRHWWRSHRTPAMPFSLVSTAATALPPGLDFKPPGMDTATPASDHSGHSCKGVGADVCHGTGCEAQERGFQLHNRKSSSPWEWCSMRTGLPEQLHPHSIHQDIPFLRHFQKFFGQDPEQPPLPLKLHLL